MPFTKRTKTVWRLRNRSLALGERTAVMGILNVTPDSFSDGGQFRNSEDAIAAGLRMFEEGAAIVDIGGESTRPGTYRRPTAEQEAERVLPVIQEILKALPAALLSIDTYHASTARLAVAAGVEIVNDVSGFLWDEAMGATCAELQCGVVMMHTRGRPEDWKALPPLPLGQVVSMVRSELRERKAAATAAGIEAGRLVVDPGLGFGKAFDENYPLLAHLDAIRSLGVPVLAGVSRKGFLGRTLAPLNGGTDAPASLRGTATIAALTAAALGGADIVRVHDVGAAVEASAIADAILSAAS